MKKEVYQVKVSVDDRGTIWLSQEAEVQSTTEHQIMLSPDQIDLIIEHLKKAKDEGDDRIKNLID